MAVFNGATAEGKPLIGVVYTREFEDFAERDQFPFLLEIAIAMDRTLENGMPDREELEAVNAFEVDVIDAVSAVMTVHKVGRVTGGGIRKIFCYVADEKKANTFFSVFRMTRQPRTFRYGISRDPAWSRVTQLGLFTTAYDEPADACESTDAAEHRDA